MKTICLIIPYFGKLPPYFPFFLISCKYNPTINWIIFTNDRTQYLYPENVKVIYTTFEVIKERIQSNFDFKICLDSPYKLCDFKVVYGEVFQKELQEYDFWGYCDLDIIWGNIREYITDDILNRYNRILTRGHLSIFRNNKECNSWYRTLDSKGCQNYKEVFCSSHNYAFDEWAGHLGGGLSEIIKRNGIEQFDEKPFADLLFLSRKFVLVNQDNKDYLSFGYNKGRLTGYYIQNGVIQKEDYMYCHFQKREALNRCIYPANEKFCFVSPDVFVDYFIAEDMDIHEYKKKINYKRPYLVPIKFRYKQIIKKIEEVI